MRQISSGPSLPILKAQDAVVLTAAWSPKAETRQGGGG